MSSRVDRRAILFASCVLHSVCSFAVVHAQTPRGQEFFGRDYAKNPLESSPRKKPSPLKDTTSKEQKAKSSTLFAPSEKEGFTDVDTTPEIKESHGAVLRKVDGTPSEVKSLGAIINCHDRTHCSENFERLFSLTEKFSFKLSNVYLIGDPLTDRAPLEVDDSLASQLRALEVSRSVYYKFEPPESYKVTRSPSWLIETPKDVVVLEGIETIERYFTDTGKFLDPRIPQSGKPSAK